MPPQDDYNKDNSAPMALRLLLNVMMAIGVAFLVAEWNVRSGIAVGIAALFVAMMVTRYQIGPKRFLALFAFASLGKALPRVAKYAIEVTEEEGIPRSDDWMMNWITQAWYDHPPRLLIAVTIVVSSALGGFAVAAVDYDRVKNGNDGILLPIENLKTSLGNQAIVLGCAITTAVSSLALSIYSIALRRLLLATAIVGACLGGIIGLSVDGTAMMAIHFALYFLFLTIIGYLLFACLMINQQSEDDQTD